MDEDQPTGESHQAVSLLDFSRLGRHLRTALVPLAAVGLAALVIDALRSGLTFARLLRWATIVVAAVVLVTAVIVTAHTASAAGRAQRRGERLTGQDVRLLPPRRRR